MATPLEIVQGVLAAFSRANVPDLLRAVSADVVWDVAGPIDIPFAGHHFGKAEVEGFFRRLMSSIQFTAFEVEGFLEQGDQVAAIGAWSGYVRSTGKPFGSEFVLLFTVRAEQIVAYRAFYDTASTASAFAADAAAE